MSGSDWTASIWQKAFLKRCCVHKRLQIPLQLSFKSTYSQWKQIQSDVNRAGCILSLVSNMPQHSYQSDVSEDCLNDFHSLQAIMNIHKLLHHRSSLVSSLSIKNWIPPSKNTSTGCIAPQHIRSTLLTITVKSVSRLLNTFQKIMRWISNESTAPEAPPAPCNYCCYTF